MRSGGLRGRTFCLVTSGHLASNPRIVKEADALADAGAHVTVVGLQTMPSLRPFDLELAATRRWSYRPIDVSPAAGAWTYGARAMRERALRSLPNPFWGIQGLVEGAFSRQTGVLAGALTGESASMFIAHNLAALPAAATAAARCGAALGFDAEDYHVGELPDGPAYDTTRRRVLALEDRYLPRCRHLTAASPDIAERYAQRLRRPVISVLNVFPLSERPPHPVAPESAHPHSLYWFSQAIGPDRGLEPMLEILARMEHRPLLQMRGTFVGDFRGRLVSTAERLGVAAQLRFLPRAAPGEMAPLAAGHSLGLSIETTETENRRVCLANKIFTYLLAGVPVLLSDTPAQRRLAAELGDAARVIDLANARESARAIEDWLDSPARYAAAREVAWRLGGNRFNWDQEKKVFLASAEAALRAAA